MIDKYLEEIKQICSQLDLNYVSRMLFMLNEIKHNSGRLFILGIGGSAANASHAVNDFRKTAGIESYSPADNIAELTAWTNDLGWQNIFEKWLQESRLNSKDAILILSVGGGKPDVSPNLIRAIDFSKSVGSKILGIVGRDGGYTKEHADCCILIPVVNKDNITSHSESFQEIIWHYLVNNIK